MNDTLSKNYVLSKYKNAFIKIEPRAGFGDMFYLYLYHNVRYHCSKTEESVWNESAWMLKNNKTSGELSQYRKSIGLPF